MKYLVNFEGNLGRNLVTPRGLNAQLVNNFVGVQGIVTKMTINRPKLQESTHYCERTERVLKKNYSDEYDLTSAFNLNISRNVPLKDQEGNPLTPEFGYWICEDYQVITVQELPERAPTGLLPRSIDVVIQGELVDKVKPGDRIQVTGVFKCIASGRTVFSGVFNTKLIATGVELLKEDEELLE